MNLQVLVSGCSYTFNYQGNGIHWPNNLFAPHNVINLSRSAAGNLYISMSIINWIKQNKNPSFVFVLWSGYRRVDWCVPSDSSITDNNNYGKLENTRILFSGGQYTHWDDSSMNEYFLSQYNTNNQKYLLDQSSMAIMNCHNFLKSQNLCTIIHTQD